MVVQESLIRHAVIATLLCLTTLPALAVDEAAANAVLKESRCSKCHAIGAAKVGPSFREIAAKYRGKADAEARLVRHVTEANEVEVDGEKEAHGLVKNADPAQVKNLVRWILSR